MADAAAALGARTGSRSLRTGRGLHADVYVEGEGERRRVVKDYRARPAWLRATWGRWICARERAVYRTLEERLGRAGPAGWRPDLVEERGPLAFALADRPGRPLSRAIASELPAGFMGELERAVRAMHDAGVVHLDLSHRSNVLVDDRGAPVLIDFASAVTAPPGGLRHRLLVGVLGALDRRALRKWRRKLASAR